VKRLLQYTEHSDPKHNFIVIEKHRIQRVRSEHTLSVRDRAMVSEEQIKFGLNINIIKLLEHQKFIKYTEYKVKNDPVIRVRAELNIITQDENRG
jgi:hypothetical protein